MSPANGRRRQAAAHPGPGPHRVSARQFKVWHRSTALQRRSTSPADAKPLVDIVPRFRRLAGVARRRRGNIGGPRLTMADRCRQRARADRPGGWRRRLVVRRVLRPGAPCDSYRQDCRRCRPDAAGARAARSMSTSRNQTSAPASKDVRTTFAGDHSRQPARPPSQVSPARPAARNRAATLPSRGRARLARVA